MEKFPSRKAANESEVFLMENLYLLCKSIHELEVELDASYEETQSWGDDEDPRWDAHNVLWDTLAHMEERAAELREEAAALPALDPLPWQLVADIRELWRNNPRTCRYDVMRDVADRINSVVMNPDNARKREYDTTFLRTWLAVNGFDRDLNGFRRDPCGAAQAQLLLDYLDLIDASMPL